MKISDIENNISMPVTQSYKYRLILLNAERLQIRQSFLVQGEVEEKLKAAGAKTALVKSFKEKGWKFLVKDVDENAIRIWRIK